MTETLLLEWIIQGQISPWTGNTIRAIGHRGWAKRKNRFTHPRWPIAILSLSMHASQSSYEFLYLSWSHSLWKVVPTNYEHSPIICVVIVTYIWQKLNSVEREVTRIVIDFWQLFSHIIGETQRSQRLLKGTYWLVVPLRQIDVNSAANTLWQWAK